MDSLGNVGGGGRFDEPVLETLQQMGVPEDAIDYLRNNVRSEHYLHPQGAVPAAPRITKVAREKSPDLTEMLDAFGHVSGHPMKALEGSLVNREMPAWEELAMLESKLGLGKSEWPHWVSGKSTLNLFDPNREKMSTEPNPYGRSGALDASERETFHGMRHELSDDQKIQLAMIIATILRRQQGGSYGKLGEPGAN